MTGTLELAQLMELSRPALEAGAFIPVSMDGLSASFQVTEPTGSRQDLKFGLQIPGISLYLTAASSPDRQTRT